MHNTNQSLEGRASLSCPSSWFGLVLFAYSIFMVGDCGLGVQTSYPQEQMRQELYYLIRGLFALKSLDGVV